MLSDKSKKEASLSTIQYGLAGATTGTITRFLVQPLDVLKIRFQLQITPRSQKEKAKYTSVLQAVSRIVKEEGAPGLWKGHIPAQFLSIVFGAVQFSSFEVFSKYLHNSHPADYTSYEHLANIGCGSAAGFAATVLSFPFDVIKTHLVYQSQPKVYNGMFDAIRKIYNKEGPRGFTKGMFAACVQTTPMSGLVFCFHGIFTQMWYIVYQNFNDTKPSVMTTTGSMTTGLLSGLCAKTIVYPFDLMKKRLQIQGFNELGNCKNDMIVCKKIRQCFMLTVKNEGVSGLFKGFIPTLIKSGATTSLYFTIYEKVCYFMLYAPEKR